MEKFNQFQIEEPETIFGGVRQETRYSTGTSGGRDLYEDGIVIFFEPDEQY